MRLGADRLLSRRALADSAIVEDDDIDLFERQGEVGPGLTLASKGRQRASANPVPIKPAFWLIPTVQMPEP